MHANTLDEEAIQLLAFAKDIVTVLGARRTEAEREAEKYFRASLAAAEFAYGACDAHRCTASACRAISRTLEETVRPRAAATS